MRVAVIRSDQQNDLAALMAARELRSRNHEVTFVVPEIGLATSTPDQASAWRAEGFAWLPVSSSRLFPAREHFPREPSLAAARSLSDILIAFDVAWFFESHWAMPTLRNRRFRDRRLPIVILSPGHDQQSIPGTVEEINQAGAIQYAIQWADAVCDSEDGIRRIEELWNSRRTAPACAIPPASTSPAVTVCIPYYNAPEWLPLTLQSLERQTSKDFTVVVVDDGSDSVEAQTVFEACESRYSKQGWTFVRQTNQSPGAARNRAARDAISEFLIFLDADDIAMPSMVERFLRGALLTGDDCLIAPNYGFRDDPEGPCALLYDPPGGLIASMGDDMHGGSCMLVRREAFTRIGGFTEIAGIGFEDYEFHIRCNLEGLRWDVLPEFVYRYRMPQKGNVSRSTDRYANQARVLRWYEQRLRGSGLRQLPLAFASLFRKTELANDRIEGLRNIVTSRLPKPPGQSQVRLLLLTCYFPYGAFSGWHTRVREMIRYFGSRYELTLVAPMMREQFAPVRKEALRYLAAVRGVEAGEPASDEDLPPQVRHHYTETLRNAVNILPTDQFHATILDQIFMAEFRNQIDSPLVLTEHNIESRLLHQASGPCARHAVHLESYENATWPAFPVRAVVSETDREHMNSRVKCGKTVVAANGANLRDWLPRLSRQTATILFPGALSYFPNIDAVGFLLTEIWPRVRKHRPDARLILAGRQPSDEMRAAAAAAPGVELYADPKSMKVLAARASLTIAPLRLGSGTRCKILESMAWGLPVVSTTLGAEGIVCADGEHLLIRDTPDTLAEAICELLSNESLWRKLRESGRQLVRERYSWDRVFEPLEDALLELIRK